MRAELLYRDRNFADTAKDAVLGDDVIKDLELTGLLETMAAGDETIYKAVSAVMARPLADVETIRYRQGILQDFIACPELIATLYSLVTDTIEREGRCGRRSIMTNFPGSILFKAIDALTLFATSLETMRKTAEEYKDKARSEGLLKFFRMLEDEVGADYLKEMRSHLSRLRFTKGILASTQLGGHLQAGDYTLLEETAPRGTPLFGRLFGRFSWYQWFKKQDSFTYMIPNHDERGARALSDLRDKTLNTAANAAAKASDHILGFFENLLMELGFYLGCVNAHRALEGLHVPLTNPVPHPAGSRVRVYRELCDVRISLSSGLPAVGNTLSEKGKNLTIITGANGGGKTTFLRSAGQAQLMMQCGMFVTASAYEGNLVRGLFTHFGREEDEGLQSGRLDEELERMSGIVDLAVPDSLVLCNESFSSTNEREGSEIGRQIVCALLEEGIEVMSVTHLFAFADAFYREDRGDYLFLRAERGEHGTRPFELQSARPLSTGFGGDLYRKIFAESLK